MQLVPPPLIRLGDVEVGAVVVAGEHSEAVAADGIVRRRHRRVVGAQPASELEVGGCRALCRTTEIERLTFLSQVGEAPVGTTPDITLRRAGQCLTASRNLL